MHKQPYTVLPVTQTVAHKNKEQKTLTNNTIWTHWVIETTGLKHNNPEKTSKL